MYNYYMLPTIYAYSVYTTVLSYGTSYVRYICILDMNSYYVLRTDYIYTNYMQLPYGNGL